MYFSYMFLNCKAKPMMYRIHPIRTKALKIRGIYIKKKKKKDNNYYNTVKPLLTDPLRSRQPLNNGHRRWHQPLSPYNIYSVFSTSEIRTTSILLKFLNPPCYLAFWLTEIEEPTESRVVSANYEWSPIKVYSGGSA